MTSREPHSCLHNVILCHLWDTLGKSKIQDMIFNLSEPSMAHLKIIEKLGANNSFLMGLVNLQCDRVRNVLGAWPGPEKCPPNSALTLLREGFVLQGPNNGLQGKTSLSSGSGFAMYSWETLKELLIESSISSSVTRG